MFGCVESKSKCDRVQSFVWDMVVTECGDFSGVKELTIDELGTLIDLCHKEIAKHTHI